MADNDDTLFNGLTRAETEASASCAGLTQPAEYSDEWLARRAFGAANILHKVAEAIAQPAGDPACQVVAHRYYREGMGHYLGHHDKDHPDYYALFEYHDPLVKQSDHLAAMAALEARITELAREKDFATNQWAGAATAFEAADRRIAELEAKLIEERTFRDAQHAQDMQMHLAQAARIAELEADASRLDWMIEKEARIGWNREGDSCRVWSPLSDVDEAGNAMPVTGWDSGYDSPRAAIDDAMQVLP